MWPTPAAARYSATGAAEPAGAYDQCVCGQQFLLTVDADLVEQNMARVTQQLAIVHA
jgi:hypothetical protein